MLPIYICDDNQGQLHQIKSVIEDSLLIFDLHMEIKGSFLSPEPLLHQIQIDKPVNGVYFLDLDYKTSFTGIDLANELRHIDPRAFIIFVTTHDEMALLTLQYKTEPLDFIIKDSSDYRERIQKCLLNIITKSKLTVSHVSEKIPFSSHHKEYFIPWRDIVYIETISPHKCSVHYKDGILEVCNSLKEIFTTLNSHFVFCHKSCIANTLRIKELNKEKGSILFDNGISCLCSSRKYNEIKRMLQ